MELLAGLYFVVSSKHNYELCQMFVIQKNDQNGNRETIHSNNILLCDENYGYYDI